nr:hypothetical protein [Tanacetum cinerariifolium]
MSKIREQVILRTKNIFERGHDLGSVSPEKTLDGEDVEEVFTIGHKRPEQYVMMGVTLTTNCKQLLADILRENMKIYPLVEPMVHKRRPMAPEERLALKENVFRWLKEGLIRKVKHPEWITNAIPIKLANGTWKMRVDYSSLNKVCARDMYPFPEEGEELASLRGIKNSAATLQRMMEKGLADQRGRNMEVYLEEIVMKRKNKLDPVQDVEETLRKLKRVNIKIDPVTSSFRVKKGRNEIISSAPLVEREGIQIPVSYVSRPLQEMEICYTPIVKMVQILIHTTRSLRAIFRKHKVKVVTDGPMEEMLKLFEKEGRLAKWAAEIWTYDISYIPRKEAEGSIVKKFFGQGEQVHETLDKNEEVPDHTPPKNFELQSRGVNRIGNYKVGIPQSGNICGYQNKTIGRRDKQQQEGKSNKKCTKCKTKLQLGS